MEQELEAYKLSGGVSPETVTYYHNLKKRTIAICEGVRGRLKNYEQEVKQIDEMILSLFKPERWADRETDLIRNFDKNCIALTKHLNIQEPKRLPVREFIGAMQELKELLKPSKRQLNGKSY